MLKTYKPLFLLLSASTFALASTSLAATNPTSAKIKIYGVAISKNADCSGAQVVNYNANGTTYDLLSNPTLFSGILSPGTYQCVVLYMDDLLTFIPSGNDGVNCVAGQTYQRVVCHNDHGQMFTNAQPDANNILQFTGTQLCSASNSQDLTHVDKVLLFISTNSAPGGNNAFIQPTTAGSANGIQLTSPLVVASGGGSGTFVINFNGQINGSGSTCDLGPPTFAFR